MRSRARPRHRFAALAGVLALTSTVGLGLLGTADARASVRDTVQDGAFHGPLEDSWTCTGDVTRTERGIEGRPGSHDLAGCTQLVSVQPYGTYELTATVAGSFAFVGVSGGDTTEVYRWADGSGRTELHATVRIGPTTQVLGVYFHGWYGQGPYQVQQISLVGNLYIPVCPSMTGAPPPSTRAPGPAALVPSPSPTWTGMNCYPPPVPATTRTGEAS
ncbi:hypothetical protein ACI1MP_02405 [Kitasatospora griseola]|uniref:hypothetical protein n=1 Tax=Kitasatospora griseola TaxID=2064 RepID=UPI003855CE31